MARETRLLTDDIANEQLIDTHPKPGTRLQKIVDKKVIETMFKEAVVVPGGNTSVRLDLELEQEIPAPNLTDLGVLVGTGADKAHSLFKTGTDDAVTDLDGKEILGNLSNSPAINFPAAMTLASNLLGVVGAADVAVGDIIRITGQGLLTPFQATVVTQTGVSSFLLSAPFPGASGTYQTSRLARWQLSFFESDSGLATALSASPLTIDIGFQKRVFFADASEKLGASALLRPALIPESGLAEQVSKRLQELINALCIHDHRTEAFDIQFAPITTLKMTQIDHNITTVISDPGTTVAATNVAKIQVYLNGQLLLWNGNDYTWTEFTDLIKFTTPLQLNDVVTVKELVTCDLPLGPFSPTNLGQFEVM